MSLGSIKEIRKLGEKCLPNDGKSKICPLYSLFLASYLIRIQQENDLVIKRSAYLQVKSKVRGVEFMGNSPIG